MICGDGTFRTAVNYSTGSGTAPYSVAVGDFNRDGTPDLAVADYWETSVGVLLGNGDGTFRTAADYPTGIAPVSAAVGNFRGNGILDLAVANAGSNTVQRSAGQRRRHLPWSGKLRRGL